MYDIKPLEDEWKKYNKKRRKPWYILGIIGFLLIVTSFLFLKYNISDLLKFNDDSSNKVIAIPLEKKLDPVLINGALTKLAIKEKKNKIFTEITDIKPATVTVEDNNPMDEKEIMHTSTVKKIKKPIVKVKPKIVKKLRKKMHLNIIKTTSISAYKDVAKRFYESHDADDSLFLAKSYYRKGNYKKAEHWALETNKVNGNIEESWLIYAKTKVKLGRRNEAIRVLMSYVKRSNSSRAKNLLYKIKKGIF